jgi:hypothetical protein
MVPRMPYTVCDAGKDEVLSTTIRRDGYTGHTLETDFCSGSIDDESRARGCCSKGKLGVRLVQVYVAMQVSSIIHGGQPRLLLFLNNAGYVAQTELLLMQSPRCQQCRASAHSNLRLGEGKCSTSAACCLWSDLCARGGRLAIMLFWTSGIKVRKFSLSLHLLRRLLTARLADGC